MELLCLKMIAYQFMILNMLTLYLLVSSDDLMNHTGKCIHRFGGIYAYESFLSIQYVHGDLCKHLGIDSSTDHPDQYSNLFLNAYINRHVHAEYLKMI